MNTSIHNSIPHFSYGFYDKLKREDVGKQVQISKTRLLPFESFENTLDVYTITQGEKGHWL